MCAYQECQKDYLIGKASRKMSNKLFSCGFSNPKLCTDAVCEKQISHSTQINMRNAENMYCIMEKKIADWVGKEIFKGRELFLHTTELQIEWEVKV